jgi:hypothetical protein
MADLSSLLSKLSGLDAPIKKAFTSLFTELVPDIRFGHPTGDNAKDAAKNFGGGFFQGTTHATPNTEFSITHGFGRVPYLAIPVLPLDQVNSQIVPLKVTQAADNKRVYFSSSEASAAFTVFIEG